MKAESRNDYDDAHSLHKDNLTQPSNKTTNAALIQLKTRSLHQPNLLETSFESDMGVDHVQNIVDASVDFLKAALVHEFDEQKGFKDETIFLRPFDYDSCQQLSIEELLTRNPLFTKVMTQGQFTTDMKSEPNLMKLLKVLSKNFPEEIFHQICVIIYESWELYLKERSKTQLNSEFACMMLPRHLDFDHLSKAPEEVRLRHLSSSEVVALAEEGAEQIAATYYLSAHLKYLNLHEAEAKKNSEHIVRNEFSRFISVIVKSVFLAVEGDFKSPGEEPSIGFSGIIPSLDESYNESSHSDLQSRKRTHRQFE